MTLRARIAAVAGLAVALAILATAVFTYVAVRSSLRGEVDSALEERAERFDRAGARGERRLGGPGPPRPRMERLRRNPPGPGPGGLGGPPLPGDARGYGEPPPREQLRPNPSDSPFGGAEGYTQFVTSSGAVLKPPGATASLPVEDRALEIAQSGDGRYLTDVDVDGAHLRVLTQATGSSG